MPTPDGSLPDTRPHVVVVGGGFGGLAATRELARHPDRVRVTLVDRRNHHLFQPLLYEVATAALNPADIASPIRSVFRTKRNVRTLLAEVRGIDTARHTLLLDDNLDLDSGELTYDWLVLATGATHAYFGHDEWREHAPGLKTVEDALEIRRRILLAYEAAERETDEAEQHAWLTFAVIGAGPTGVELAGALSEIGRHTVARDFRNIDPTRIRVVLIEGADRILPPFHPTLSAKAEKQLTDLGVEVVKGALAKQVDRTGVTLDDGRRIAARTTLWAAGVEASPLGGQVDGETDRAGRVRVRPDLSVDGHPEIFVIGDLASVDDRAGKPVPGVAPAASQGGTHAARSIMRRIAGREPEPFRYVDKGALATIGRARAVAEVKGMRLSGFTAWMLWWAVHIFFLIGFRNRVLVMFGWIWSYLTFGRGARLITGGPRGDRLPYPATEEPTTPQEPSEPVSAK